MRERLRKLPVSTKLCAWLLGIICGLVIVHLVLQYINLNIFNQEVGEVFELSNRFDLDDEVSVATWASQTIYVILALLALLAAKLARKNSERRLWLVIVIGSIAGSIDEGSGLHEFILQVIHNINFLDQAPTFFANAWWLLLPFVVLGAVWLVYKMYKLFDITTVLLFACGITIFVIGAIFVDQLTSFLSVSPFMSQGILVAIEEGCELVGLTILIFAVSRFLEINHAQSIKNALKELKA